MAQYTQPVSEAPLPPAPMLVASYGNNPLPLEKMTVTVDAHMSVMIVTINGTWSNLSTRPEDLRLDLPINQRSTICNVSIITRSPTAGVAYFNTDLVSLEDIVAIDKAKSRSQKGFIKNDSEDGYKKYNPNVFRLPVPNVPPQSTVEINVVYIENLKYRQGSYMIHIPLKFPPGVLLRMMKDVVVIYCNICTGTPYCQWGASSVPMNVLENSPGLIKLCSNAEALWSPVTDFDISYSIMQRDILTSLVITLPGVDGAGNFSLFVTPPDPATIEVPFPRKVIFCLDISGSMAGQPLEMAKAALVTAVESLRAQDMFNIYAFDDSINTLAGDFMQGSTQNKYYAIDWVKRQYARGGTNIHYPVTLAVESLMPYKGNMEMPLVVLITDGMVSNEREIVEFCSKQPIRVSCCGIGPYCNSAFLKHLAASTRGYSEACLDFATLQEDIMDLITRSSTPVLKDVDVVMAGLTSCELYPFPIPDLFCGGPITISGRYTGIFPQMVNLRGRTHAGQSIDLPITTTVTSTVPIDKLFARQQLDIMVARAWMSQDVTDRRKCERVSINTGVPCAYTAMVCYQPVEPQQQQPGAQPQQPKSQRNKSGQIAAVAVGGLAAVVVLAAVAPHFGDIGATLSNASVGNALTSIGTGGMEMITDVATTVLSTTREAIGNTMSMGGGSWASGGHSHHTHTNNSNCDCKCCEDCCTECGKCCESCCNGFGSCLEGCGNICTECCKSCDGECLGACCSACCEGLGSCNC